MSTYKIWNDTSMDYEYFTQPSGTTTVIPVGLTEIENVESVIEVVDISAIQEVEEIISVLPEEEIVNVISEVEEKVVIESEGSDNIFETVEVITIVEDNLGSPGQSAYQLWLSKGNSGTEQDFLDALAAGGIVVDSTLSSSSVNPLENQAINTALGTKEGTISDLSTIRSGAASGATALQVHQSLEGKVDKVSGKGLSTNDLTGALKAEIAANTLKTHFPGHQDISGKVDTVSGEGLIIDTPTADGTYTYKVENGTATWNTFLGGGSSQYQAFRTIDGSTLQWDDDVTDVATRVSEGWTIISGLTTDTFDVSNYKLRRLT